MSRNTYIASELRRKEQRVQQGYEVRCKEERENMQRSGKWRVIYNCGLQTEIQYRRKVSTHRTSGTP